MEPKIIDHLAARQCSAQWKPFLQVMAQELSEHGSETELRVLALRMGSRFAARFDLGACQTVQEMQTAMNQVWREIDWGWVTLEETPVHLAIHHRCSPLTAAFDGASPSWISGFLEGVYQRWFETLGASALQVQQVSSPDEFGSIEFRLGQ